MTLYLVFFKSGHIAMVSVGEACDNHSGVSRVAILRQDVSYSSPKPSTRHGPNRGRRPQN